MARKWRGDDSYQLPALQVEPYRLWFEFLRLAATDPTLRLNERVYRPWGNYREQEFSDWWREHWRNLFSVTIGVREVGKNEKTHTTLNALVVSIPLHQEQRRTIGQIRNLLNEHHAGLKLKTMPKGAFFLSVGKGKDGRIIHPSTRFLRNLPKVRLLMHVYRFWLQHPDLNERRRLEETAKAYFAWANAWNRKIVERGWKRQKIEIPFSLAEYAKFLAKRGNRQRVTLFDLNETDIPNHRRQIARYIRKARQIAANVGRGQFTGSYA